MIIMSKLQKMFLVQSQVFVSTLIHSVGLGFSQTVALKPKSRLAAHHYHSGGSRITLAHLSVTHTLHGLTSSLIAKRLFDRWSMTFLREPFPFFFLWLFNDPSRVRWRSLGKLFTHILATPMWQPHTIKRCLCNYLWQYSAGKLYVFSVFMACYAESCSFCKFHCEFRQSVFTIPKTYQVKDKLLCTDCYDADHMDF